MTRFTVIFRTLLNYLRKTTIIGYCAQQANLEAVKWLRELGFVWDGSTMNSAAFGGSIEVVKWLKADGCSWGEWAIIHASLQGNIVLVKWLINNGCPWRRSELSAARHKSDNVEIDEILRKSLA